MSGDGPFSEHMVLAEATWSLSGGHEVSGDRPFRSSLEIIEHGAERGLQGQALLARGVTSSQFQGILIGRRQGDGADTFAGKSPGHQIGAEAAHGRHQHRDSGVGHRRPGAVSQTNAQFFFARFDHRRLKIIPAILVLSGGVVPGLQRLGVRDIQ